MSASNDLPLGGSSTDDPAGMNASSTAAGRTAPAGDVDTSDLGAESPDQLGGGTAGATPGAATSGSGASQE